ncbi:putative short-chain dehydrogenase/reductase [Hypoxylon crocopeplum]|nr:putative short-chain dehydrogenase/reductase [Hypoxylon crocopeplum]
MAKKTVLITGCSDGGIGATMAKEFAAQGYHVFATLRNLTKAKSLEGVDGVEILQLEVTSKESVEQCAAEVEKRTGGTLDILVNNAGADFVIPLLDVSIDEAKKLYDINVWGILLVTQAFAPMLIKAKGCVANFSSIAGIMPLSWSGIYSSSKAAAKQMSEILRVELQPLGVRVITAMVGAVVTPIHDRAGELDLPAGSPYQNIRDLINDVRKGVHKPGAVKVEVASKALISDITSGKTGLVWRGGTASLSRYLGWLLPNGVWESVVNNGRGLNMVKPGEK